MPQSGVLYQGPDFILKHLLIVMFIIGFSQLRKNETSEPLSAFEVDVVVGCPKAGQNGRLMPGMISHHVEGERLLVEPRLDGSDFAVEDVAVDVAKLNSFH